MSRWMNGSLQHLLTRSPDETVPRLPVLDAGAFAEPPRAHDSGERLAYTDDVAARASTSPLAHEPDEHDRFIDAITNDDLNLTVSLVCLEQLLGGMPYDCSIRAAAETLRCRVQELGDLRDALHAVITSASDPRIAPLFATDGPLAAFVKGLYVWSDRLVDAFEELALGLRAFAPDWALLRHRLDESTGVYFDGLVPAIRRDVAHAALSADEAEAILAFNDELETAIWAASWLAKNLPKRFG